MIAAVLIFAGAGFLALFNSALAVYALAGSALVGVAAMVGGSAAMLLARRSDWRRRCCDRVDARVRQLGVCVAGAAELRRLQAGARPCRGAARSAPRPDDLLVTYNVALAEPRSTTSAAISRSSTITDRCWTCCSPDVRSFLMVTTTTTNARSNRTRRRRCCLVSPADVRRQAEECACRANACRKCCC